MGKTKGGEGEEEEDAGFNEKKRRGYDGERKDGTRSSGRRRKKEREKNSDEDVATAQMQNAR